ASKNTDNDSIWTLIYQLPKEDFKMKYLDDILDYEVKVSSIVKYNSRDFVIFTLYEDSFIVKDHSPPRVVGTPRYEFNDEVNPTNITFYTDIIDYGSEISNVSLFYYFKEFNSEGGSGSSISENWRNAKMAAISENEGIFRYSITVLFDHNQTSREIIYFIQTTDALGNIGIVYDINNDPDRINETRFTYTPPGIDPTFVLIIVGITIVSAIFGSIVYVKFIRKPELVGLDKELVMNSLSEVNDIEINNSLDDHTIGVVVSFFDQRHGPIPIIVEPEILRDNFSKLVELSDRSFSSTGFCDNFNAEITSSYDFVLAQGTRSKILSFGFALERPNARGGQENLTANILVHQELFPLVNQFLLNIKQQTHIIHKLMNDDRKKAQVRIKVKNLRRYISKIILSYEKIYGDAAEFIEEELI
ncbi:MAG: hypothetical protein ACXACR_17410, partial [Candidatus Hodarchaeales archaeon]